MRDVQKKPTPPASTPALPRSGDGQPGYYGLQILPPLTAVVELALIVAALLAADQIWPALDINNLQPSPYWIPVLLLSLQYGTASGTLAVIVAIAVYFSLVTLPEQGVGENEFTYRLRLLGQPILWIATAVLLGQFRMVQIAAKRELTRGLSELEAQRVTLADYANRLRGRCDALERDIASRPWHAGAGLLASLAELANPKSATPAAIERCLALAFPGAALSLFVRQGAQLIRVATTGWPADAPWLTRLPADHVLTEAILGSRAALNVLDDNTEATLAGQGFAAVAVLDNRSGRPLGMLKLESADARFLSPGLCAQLDVLASAIAPALIEQGGLVTIARAEADAPLPLRPPQRLVRAQASDDAADLARPKASR